MMGAREMLEAKIMNLCSCLKAHSTDNHPFHYNSHQQPFGQPQIVFCASHPQLVWLLAVYQWARVIQSELHVPQRYRSKNALSSRFASPPSSKAFSNFCFHFSSNSSPCSPRHASSTPRNSLPMTSRVPLAVSLFLNMGFSPFGPVRTSTNSKATLRLQLR